MWYLRTFGGLSLDANGHAAPSASRRRPLAMLALLAVAGERGLSREKIVALLWPESDEERARNSLSQALASLRRDMTTGEPVVGSAELRLNPSVITSEVAEFEQCVASGALERAAALYQGPFLDGFYLREAAEFERWVEGQRRRLQDACASALGRLARAADESADHEAAIGWWRRLATLEPTNARAVSGLMRDLASMGDSAGAQRQFRVYEELMRQEFGAGPEPEVASLAASLSTYRPVPAVQHTAIDNSMSLNVAPPTAQHDATRFTSGPGTVARRRRRRAVAIGTAVVVIGGLCWFGIIAAHSSSEARRAAHAVVIRAFKNNSGDPALDPIGQMAAEWIARGLAETPSVYFASSESDLVAHDSSLGPVELGRRMHARYVISGVHYTQGDSLFLQADLWDADLGRLVLPIAAIGDAINAKSTVLERLRQRVTGALVPYFDSSIVTTSRVPPRFEAYQEFLVGDELYLPDRAESLKHLREAVRLDPSFIWARLRLISQLESTLAYDARDSAIAAVEARRDSLSPYEAAAFELRVAVARHDWHAAYLAGAAGRRRAPRLTWAAFEAGETALLDGRPNEAAVTLAALDPESSALRFDGAYYGLLCRAFHDIDRMRELRRCYDRGHQQHPKGQWYLPLGALGDARGLEQEFDTASAAGATPLSAVGGLYELDVHHRPKEARELAQRMLGRVRARAQPPDDSSAKALLDLRVALLGFLGEWREIARVVDSMPQQRRSGFTLSLRGVASAMFGDTADARRRADAIQQGRTLGPRIQRARVLAALGDKQGALELISTAGAPAYNWNYHADLIGRLMRAYPPFEQFLKPRG